MTESLEGATELTEHDPESLDLETIKTSVYDNLPPGHRPFRWSSPFEPNVKRYRVQDTVAATEWLTDNYPSKAQMYVGIHYSTGKRVALMIGCTGRHINGHNLTRAEHIASLKHLAARLKVHGYHAQFDTSLNAVKLSDDLEKR